MRGSGSRITRWAGLILPCAVIALRLPALISNTELNVDESLFGVAALKYSQGGLPWRDVDTATSGPLNPLPLALVLPWLPGREYQAMHLCAALLVAATVWLTWKTLVRLTSPPTAALASAVGLAWIAVAQAPDHVHYSSELWPILMLSAADYCLVRGQFGAGATVIRWLLAAAILAGAAPWAKLQSVPISIVIAFCALLIARRHYAKWTAGRYRFLQAVGVVLGGFLLPTTVIVAITVSSGGWTHLWQSYVLSNTSYVQEPFVLGWLWRIVKVIFLVHNGRYPPIVLGLGLITAIWWVCVRAGWERLDRRTSCFAWMAVMQLLAALVAVSRPLYLFPHYAWFLFHPSIVVLGLILEAIRRSDDGNSSTAPWVVRRSNPIGLRAASMYALVFLSLIAPAIKAAKLVAQAPPDPFVLQVSRKISEEAPGKRTMTIWGWAPTLFLKTGLMPTSRDIVPYWAIVKSPQQQYFQASFIQEFSTNSPDVIVDAIAPPFLFWTDFKSAPRLEDVPELEQTIKNDYSLVSSLRKGNGGKAVRIYVRRSPKTSP